MSAHYDVVVLGAGPGGYVAAIRAAQLGQKVAIIEKQWWGGVCLNVGCIPTKSLLRNAELAHILTHDKDLFGIEGEVTFNFGKAFTRSRDVSNRMVGGIHYLMKKNKITEYNGWGTIVDAKSIEVKTDTGTEVVTFDNLILATGSTTRMIPGTSRRILRTTTSPEFRLPGGCTRPCAGFPQPSDRRTHGVPRERGSCRGAR